MTDSPYGDGPFVVARSNEPMGDGQPVSVAGKPILFTDHGNAEPVAYAMITAESAETGKEFSEVDQHWQVRSQHQQQEAAAVGDADDSWWQQASFDAGSMHSVMESIEEVVYELGQDIPDEKLYVDARAEYEQQATDALTGLRQQHQQVGDALDRLDELIANDKQ